MKTFLKAVLLLIAAVIALKLLPLTFALGCIVGLAIVALVAVGAGVVGVLLATVLLLAVVSSPIWVPVLAIVGLVALVKDGKSPPAVQS